MPESLSLDEILRLSPLFRTVDRKAQDELIEQLHLREFRAGDRLIAAGDTTHHLLFLLQGTADVWARDGERRYRVASLEAGALLGEMSFFNPRAPRTADVVATTHGAVAAMTTGMYDALCRDNPNVAAALEKAVLSLLADRLEETNRTMAHLMDQYRSSGLQAALGWLARLFKKGG